jgi:hypothetical protein
MHRRLLEGFLIRADEGGMCCGVRCKGCSSGACSVAIRPLASS